MSHRLRALGGRSDLSLLSDIELRQALGSWSGFAAEQAEGRPVLTERAQSLWLGMATISEKLFSREESLGGSHAEDLATLRGRQEIIADLAVLNRFRGIDGFKLRGLLDQTHRVLDAIRRQYQ